MGNQLIPPFFALISGIFPYLCVMKLKGRYELVVEYELPDGNYIPIRDFINFFLNDNYDAIRELEMSLDDTYIFFDDSGYGLLSTMKRYYPFRKCFTTMGFVDKDYKIIKSRELLNTLRWMHEEARDLCNNEKEYIRETKLKMVID